MPLTRREFLAVPLLAAQPLDEGEWVNDIHSQLNRTHVRRIARPNSAADLRRILHESDRVSIAGGRHAMGGQQFGTGTTLIDMRGMNRVLSLDEERGVVEVEAGILWPELLAYLWGGSHGWGILQKQTGADRLSLGGALAANIHGRGLTLKPIIDQVESFSILAADGEFRACSRAENPEIFRLAIGGYGLFGIVATIKLRLGRRRKVRRVVERHQVDEIPNLFESRIRDGFLYGDFQYATDGKRHSFFREGLFPTYQPVPDATPLTVNPTRFHPDDWERLTYWSHKNRRLAFRVYADRYLATSGQIYWSDSQLSAAYVENYHEALDRKMHASHPATEMISELYVPRRRLPAFMNEAGRLLRERRGNVIYGTVRIIEADTESYLAWARESWACVVVNLHVVHTPESIAHEAETFRGLIDLALAQGGSFYLTYHRWAAWRQIQAAYPQIDGFLALKRKYDPDERFHSDWYVSLTMRERAATGTDSSVHVEP
jgi:FAD/FMN-containing dehydrogenase